MREEKNSEILKARSSHTHVADGVAPVVVTGAAADGADLDGVAGAGLGHGLWEAEGGFTEKRRLFRHGESLVRRGESSLRDGKSLVRRKQSLVRSGEGYVQDGKSLVQSAESYVGAGESLVRRGEGCVRAGESLVQRGKSLV